MFFNVSDKFPFPDSSKHYETVILTDADVALARPLWEEVFTTDSKAFCDYYFSAKIYDNTTFVCMDQDQIIASVHMTDETMVIDGTSYATKYVVGVATKAEYRHQKIMTHLLNSAFSYFQDKISFVFLMPADPAIYTPLDFQYVYSRIGYESNALFHDPQAYVADCKSKSDYITCDMIDFNQDFTGLSTEITEFANKTLSEQYDYYLLRSPQYYEKLIHELHSENGYIFVFRKEGQIIGYFTFATEDGEDFIQEVLWDSQYADFLSHTFILPKPQPEPKPLIMVKNLSSANTDFISLLQNKKGLLNEIV